MLVNRERVAWKEQTLAIRSKDAKYITLINFDRYELEEMAKSYVLKPAAYVDHYQELRSLLSPEEDRSLLNGEMEEVECYLFNHRYADGSFFKMRLKYDPNTVARGSSKKGCYYFVGPWQEVIDSGAIQYGTPAEVYGYKEEGRVVFVFRRMDLRNFMQEITTVDGRRVGNWAVFRVNWADSLMMEGQPDDQEWVHMTF